VAYRDTVQALCWPRSKTMNDPLSGEPVSRPKCKPFTSQKRHQPIQFLGSNMLIPLRGKSPSIIYNFSTYLPPPHGCPCVFLSHLPCTTASCLLHTSTQACMPVPPAQYIPACKNYPRNKPWRHVFPVRHEHHLHINK
jgi:hypothetical protein